jgi:hypothetical protein
MQTRSTKVIRYFSEADLLDLQRIRGCRGKYKTPSTLSIGRTFEKKPVCSQRPTPNTQVDPQGVWRSRWDEEPNSRIETPSTPHSMESLERENAADGPCRWAATPPSIPSTESIVVQEKGQFLAADELTETQFLMLQEDFHSIFEIPPSGLEVVYMVGES